jgi:S-DNA-T family DNA segregation ATPase FtsK/SpoIIIE
MARAATSARAFSLLPAGTAEFLRRRAVELCGIVLFGVAVLLLLALVTFHVGDPSWNNATNAPPRNLLGQFGAHLSDLMLQWTGLAAGVPVLALAAWAWRIATHRGLRHFGLNLAVLPLAIGLSAAAIAHAPAPAIWPLPVGLGGVVGGRIAYGVDHMLAGFGPMAGLAAVPVLGLAALAGLAITMGLGLGDWRALGGHARGLGETLARLTAPLVGFVARLRGTEAPVLPRAEPRMDAATRRAPRAPRPAAEAPANVPGPAPARSAAEKRVEAAPAQLRKGRRAEQESQPALDLGPVDSYSLPPLNLLKAPPPAKRVETVNEEALEQNARMLEGVLDDFGIRGQIVKVRPGPVVTLYELEPAPGTKSARVIGLADDIARSMSAVSARVSVIPGRNVIGIELPNLSRETVYLSELLASPDYEATSAQLTLALGKDIGGAPIIADLARMPHLLVAGTTGSGKSVAINTMIMSLLYRLPPEQCKFIMIDPKMLELSVYDGIPHLLAPVVTEPAKAVVALKWTVREMEDRYRKMSKLGVRNIAGYNQRLAEARANGEVLKRTVQTGFDPETGKPVMEEQPIDLTHLPFIVVIVDEMADLMMVAGKDIEGAIQRLAQMARAAGIHIIMATQRPSVDVITGTIKANFPTRISFQVTSRIDSRTILGEQGAEQLLGQGDMLYMAGGGRITRVHGPFVSDHEVEQVVAFLKAQGEPDYLDAVTEDVDGPPGGFGGDDAPGSTGDDLYDRAVALVAREGKASTSFIQRHLQIGYNRAARIIEEMEAQGVVGKPNHVGKREVLVGDHSADAY